MIRALNFRYEVELRPGQSDVRDGGWETGKGICARLATIRAVSSHQVPNRKNIGAAGGSRVGCFCGFYLMMSCWKLILKILIVGRQAQPQFHRHTEGAGDVPPYRRPP
jgi:hypothetical protein